MDGRAPAREQGGAAEGSITPGVLWKLIDALTDGVALADESGLIVLANRQLEEIFGYRRGELASQPIDRLVPADLRAVHERHRTGYLRAPETRLMGSRARLVGLRAASAEQAYRSRELLNRVVSNLFQVGISIQAAVDQPHDLAREGLSDALRRLDDTIHEIREYVFAAADAKEDGLPGQ